MEFMISIVSLRATAPWIVSGRERERELQWAQGEEGGSGLRGRGHGGQDNLNSSVDFLAQIRANLESFGTLREHHKGRDPSNCYFCVCLTMKIEFTRPCALALLTQTSGGAGNVTGPEQCGHLGPQG